MDLNDALGSAASAQDPLDFNQSMQQLKENLVTIDDKQYIDLQYFVENQQFVLRNARQLYEAPQKVLKAITVQQKAIEKQKFKWEIGQQTIFAVVVTGLGINQARPKQILPLMPNEYCLDYYMIASHLQKYRQKIIKDYQLANMSEIQNYQYPYVLKHPVLLELSTRWREDRNFQGLNELEIKSIIKDIQ